MGTLWDTQKMVKMLGTYGKMMINHDKSMDLGIHDVQTNPNLPDSDLVKTGISRKRQS